MYEIYNENCLEGMKRIPDGSVDMILTDLPYGTTDCAFDKRLPFEPLWEQFLRVTKYNAAIVLFSQMPFGAELIMSRRKLYRYEWVWEKSLGVGFLNAKKMPLRCHENILVFYRKLPTYNPQFRQGKPYSRKGFKPIHSVYQPIKEKFASSSLNGDLYPRDVIYYPSTVGQLPERLHPTQKPVDLLEYLIRTYTDEGETILDATMGSGSTGAAAINTGRNFIGFELEGHYYDIAAKRLSTAVARREQSLF